MEGLVGVMGAVGATPPVGGVLVPVDVLVVVVVGVVVVVVVVAEVSADWRWTVLRASDEKTMAATAKSERNFIFLGFLCWKYYKMYTVSRFIKEISISLSRY